MKIVADLDSFYINGCGGVLLPPLLLLELKLEIKVLRIEAMHSEKTVLTTAAVALAVRMKCHGINGTEVIFHAAELLLKNQMKEASFELARSAVDGRVDGLLTTAQQHVILDGRDGRRVNWLLCLVRFQLLERFDVEQLGRVVLGGRYERDEIFVALQVHDLLVVRLHFV